MFDALKSLFAEVRGSGAPARSRADEGRRLAAVALLVNVANVDGEIGLAERRRLKKIIEERFGLDANTAAELIALAEESDREAVDFYNFTRVLKRTLDDFQTWSEEQIAQFEALYPIGTRARLAFALLRHAML